jgi:2,4-dienoyl-CoA reductase-like NADH-dependent reductase (Old Yellow Enzyme family)
MAAAARIGCGWVSRFSMRAGRYFQQNGRSGLRISATDWVEGGWDVEDSIVFSTALKRRGCDYICTTSGGVSLKQEINAQPGYQVPLAQAVRQGAGIATMAVGQITEPRQAESILAEQQADMIAIARRLMFNPHWPGAPPLSSAYS